MTKQQREALTALRDVMEKHNFSLCGSACGAVKIDIRDVFGYVTSFEDINFGDYITDLLETEPNDSKRVAGRDFTGSGGDL